jgi:hypothetical protein
MNEESNFKFKILPGHTVSYDDIPTELITNEIDEDIL